MQTTTPILEIKHTLSGKRLEFNCQGLLQQARELVVLYRLPHDTRIADLELEAGCLSLGYFWNDRNFNVYHWLTTAGQSLGLYVNIADRTTLSPGRVEWRDLIVDLLVTPDGRCQILDEDELPDDLPEELQRLIDQQTRHLRQRHQQLLKDIEQRSQALLQELDPV